MRDFVLYFEEKEGTTAIMRWANRLSNVRVLHYADDRCWEPLESFMLGENVRREEIQSLMQAIYVRPRNMEELRRRYAMKVPDRELVTLPDNCSIGLKMRWTPPRVFYSGLPIFDLPVNRICKEYRHRRYYDSMVQTLSDAGVAPMLAVRQNVFKWALSKYHGDGTGKKGHLQFKLASGELTRHDIPKIKVNLSRFGRLLDQCRRKHDAKRQFVEQMAKDGLEVFPLLYEDFLEDKVQFFEGFLDRIDNPMDLVDLKRSLEGDIVLKRVHKGSLSDYVENHEELHRAYGNAFESWTPPLSVAKTTRES